MSIDSGKNKNSIESLKYATRGVILICVYLNKSLEADRIPKT